MMKNLISVSVIVIFLTAVILSTSSTKAVSVNHLYISEVQISGATSDDEFIELYNPFDTPVDIHNWSIQRETITGVFTKKNFVSPAIIPGYGHYLIANTSYDGAIAPDLSHSSFNLSSTGTTVFLVNNQTLLTEGTEMSIIDKVGIGANASDAEDAPFETVPDASVSLERIFGVDTDNNQNDFNLQANPNPQNINSAPVTPVPTPLATPSPTAIPTFEPTPTDFPTLEPTPTLEPIQTFAPTAAPTQEPTPTQVPIQTFSPTASPIATAVPTANPTVAPTVSPTIYPTLLPTVVPTVNPTPTIIPTFLPSPSPTLTPSQTPTPTPSPSPISTPNPTASSTQTPIQTPSPSPSLEPTETASAAPTSIEQPTPTGEPNPSATPISNPPRSGFKNFGQWISSIARECGHLVKQFVHFWPKWH